MAPTASTSTAAYASAQRYVASASNSRRSSRSPSGESATSQHPYTRARPSASPTHRLVSEQRASSSIPSSPARHKQPAIAYNDVQAASLGAQAGGVLDMPPASHSTKLQKQKQAALDSQMQALYESEYRENVLEYMYEMEVSGACLLQT